MLEINGIDTSEREMFKDLLAKKLTGEEWVCFMDSEEKSNSFFDKFVKAVEKEKGLNWIN